MVRIILVTGGQRCGKSLFAEELALRLASSAHGVSSEDGRQLDGEIDSVLPIYVATSIVRDEEFRHRVSIHQKRRSSQWINMEEPMYLSRLALDGRVVLIDCLTLWTSNFFFEGESNDQGRTLASIRQELDTLVSNNPNSTFIFVTNEIGLGGVSANDLQRTFTDLLGSVNQYVAAMAREAYFVVSGIPLRIK